MTLCDGYVTTLCERRGQRGNVAVGRRLPDRMQRQPAPITHHDCRARAIGVSLRPDASPNDLIERNLRIWHNAKGVV